MNDIFFHILFLGIAVFQCFFMLIQWFAFRRTEYWYYIIYIIGCSVYILFRIDALYKILPFYVSPLASRLLDQPVIMFALWMYIRFGYYFLNLKKLQPAVYSSAKKLEYGFIASFVLVTVLNLARVEIALAANVFLYSTLILALVSLPVIVRLLKQRNLLNNFLVMGSLMITFGGLSGTFFAHYFSGMGNTNLNFLIGLEIGVVLELLLLNTGFMFKNRILQQQVTKTQEILLRDFEKEQPARKN